MKLSRRTIAAIAVSCSFVASEAHAALEVKLHEVNTSIGLKPTNATNQWKLETDPTIGDGSSSTANVLDPIYIPIAGSLDNTYDPTQFKLAINPSTGTYGLGYSVQGIDPFQVDSFQVDYTQGFYTVTATTNPNVDVVTPSTNPAPSGGEKGEVENITFGLIPSMKNLALPATVDQNFFELNLVPLNEGSPVIVPEKYSSGGTPGVSFLELSDPNGNTLMLTDGMPSPDGSGVTVVFNGAIVPEPAALALTSLGALMLLGRRRK